MPYTTNPHLPRLRAKAVGLVYDGWSQRKVSRYYGVCPSTISRWIKKARGFRPLRIETETSRPKHHPNELSRDLVLAVLDYRHKHNRCAKVLHYLLKRDGFGISLSSIERILRRYQLVNHSKWKKWHKYAARPLPSAPGTLVEVDTILDGAPNERLNIYTLLDVCSRWAYALPMARSCAGNSVRFVKEAEKICPFRFDTFQSDHGSEFSKYFTKQLIAHGYSHRHSRVRTPSDNGHLERFNRTLQEECLVRIPRKFLVWKKEIPEYLHYYNFERPHMALGMKTPNEVLRSY